MTSEQDRGGTSGKLDTLRGLLDTAAALVDDLVGGDDPLLGRWQRAFLRMLPEDRETIIEVVEREVELRLIAGSARETVSGYEVSRPNPNARLYTRVFGELPTYSTRDDVMRATLRAARIMAVAPPPHDDWESATLDAFRALSPTERAAIAAHNREMLSLLARIEAEVSSRS